MSLEMMQPIQRVAMISATGKFIETYLDTFDNDLRSQLIVLMGDRVLFLSDFIDEIKKKMYQAIGGKYYVLGSVDIGSLKNAIPASLVEDMVQNKIKRQDIIFAKGVDLESGTGGIYPKLFSGSLKTRMKKITENVLGRNFQVSLRFKFNRLK
jgi:hypothetical protein